MKKTVNNRVAERIDLLISCHENGIFNNEELYDALRRMKIQLEKVESNEDEIIIPKETGNDRIKV